MRSNAWTTLEELNFLEALIPQFVTQQEVRVVGPWLAEKATAFFAKFPSRSAEFDRDRMTNKLRTWFGNHTRDLVKGTDARHVLDLSGRANRRPLPLQPSQAYSALYYRQGSSIFKEIKSLYALYKAGDATTLLALQGLFEKPLDDDADATTLPSPPNPESNPESHPGETPTPPKPTRRRKKTADTAATPQPDNPPAVPATSTKKTKRKSKKVATGTNGTLCIPPFVHFQQTIIREKLKTMSDEEAAAVERHIEDSYANAMKVWEHPWLAPTKSGKSGDNLENQFYVNNAKRVDHSLQVVSEEVARQASFRTFFLWGGPGSVPGRIDIHTTDHGHTIEGGQDFPSFLGPMYAELHEKFGQWIKLTYTHEQIHRAAKTSSQTSDTPEPPSHALSPTPAGPTPSQPGVAVAMNLTSTTQPPSSPTMSSSSLILSDPVGLDVATPDTTTMDHNTFDTDCDAFGAGPGTSDGNPDAVSTPAVINPHGAAPANIISSTTTDPTTANPSVVNPSMTDSSVIIPSTTYRSVATPTSTNPHVVTPARIDGPIATGSTIDSLTTASSSVTSPATTDLDAGPAIVMRSTVSPIIANHAVTIPTMSAPELAGPPSLVLPAATPTSFNHGSSSQDKSHPAESAPGTAYPKFVTPEVITHLSSIVNVPGWSDFVQIYLKYEAASPSKSTTRLPAKGRPLEVDMWLKDPINLHVSIADTAAYIEGWTGWWTACQPTGRATASWPFAREPLASTQWGRLLNGGKYGIFLFVMALSWWAKSLGPATSPQSLTSAVSDVEWVLHQLVDALTAPPAPEPTAGVALEVPDTGRGKRKIVLTEKALDLDESVQKRYRR